MYQIDHPMVLLFQLTYQGASNGVARNKTGRTVTVDSGGKKVTLGKRRQSSDPPTTITVDDDSGKISIVRPRNSGLIYLIIPTSVQLLLSQR